MVMRNRHDGSDRPQGRDDLPPRVRSRFARPTLDEQPTDNTPNPQPPLSTADVIKDLSQFAVLLLFVTVGIMLYLLVALTYAAS